MLHEGRMQLEGAKKTIEGVQADIKAIKGIWDWLLGLFVSKPAKPAETKPAEAKPAEPASAPPPANPQ